LRFLFLSARLQFRIPVWLPPWLNARWRPNHGQRRRLLGFLYRRRFFLLFLGVLSDPASQSPLLLGFLLSDDHLIPLFEQTVAV